jgi:hypothetical protein
MDFRKKTDVLADCPRLNHEFVLYAWRDGPRGAPLSRSFCVQLCLN